MTPVTPSLVFCKVSIVYTSILMLLTLPLVMVPVETSTTLLVIRVLHLMTLVSSIAHTFLFRWFVQLEQTPSSPRLASRPATVLLLTHSLKVSPQEPVLLPLTRTATTEELLLKTSCDSSGCCGSGCPTCPFRPPQRGGLFLWK